MTEAEFRVWEFSAALKIAKDNGEADVMEFLTPLYRNALTLLMMEWREGEDALDTAA